MDRPPAKRSLGQNFLVDASIARRIVRALDPREGDALLEIGPGHGALTTELLPAVGRMAAVELDAELARRLRERFGESRLLLYREDVLRVDLAQVLADLGIGDRRLLVAGNLPYNISKPVAMRLVEARSTVERAVLMFQREVSDRLTAEPASRAYGALTVMVGAAYRVERLFDLQPGSFRPRPRVVSSVTRWTPRTPVVADAELSLLRSCLAACFARRRRTLRNNLRAVLASDRETDSLLAGVGIDGGRRPEQLEPAEFRRLARAWPRDATDALV